MSAAVDKDVISERGDAFRWVAIHVVSWSCLVVSLRYHFWHGRDVGMAGTAAWIGLNALMYRRKWRRAAGLPLLPRWSKVRV